MGSRNSRKRHLMVVQLTEGADSGGEGAPDIIDLELDEHQELSVNLNDSIVGDADLMKEDLSADNIIDMDVEGLGTIPIKIIFTGGSGEDPGFMEIGLQELMTIPVFVEGR